MATARTRSPALTSTDTVVQRVWETRSEDETRTLAAQLSHELRAGDVIALVGPLGAGKTAFVRGLAEGLGLADGVRVSSPSYALVNAYELAHPVRGAATLTHLDLYRIDAREGDEALDGLGFSDLPEDAIVVVEWPERAPAALAAATVRIDFEDLGAELRRIVLSPRDDRSVG